MYICVSFLAQRLIKISTVCAKFLLHSHKINWCLIFTHLHSRLREIPFYTWLHIKRNIAVFINYVNMYIKLMSHQKFSTLPYFITKFASRLLCALSFTFFCQLLPLRPQRTAVVSANEITALNINGKDSLWIDRGWRTTDTDKDSGLSETKLLSNANSQSNYTSDGGTDYAEVDTRNMSTFYNCRKVSVSESEKQEML